MTTVRYSKTASNEFALTLKERVNEYFKTNNLSRYGNEKMIVKSVVILLVFALPLVLINTGIIASTAALFLCYGLSGLGMAGIGMGIMHDALHGSYSKNRKVNKYMGYTMNLIGANATVWKIQHNVLHHTYTNIHEADDDINAPFFLRFSPHSKKYWIHRFQYLYAWVFYGLSTLSWLASKDFIRMNRYKKLGFFPDPVVFNKELAKMIGWKVVYLSFALILPLIIVPLPFWIILLAFFTMHFITGLLTTLIFQAAHIVPDTSFPIPDDQGVISNNWSFHQLATTSNFSPRSKFFSWMVGGLNYQIEHHLMPNICHVHYRKLAPIVQMTAEEYGIPYHIKKNFAVALWDHIKMLYMLGRQDELPS